MGEKAELSSSVTASAPGSLMLLGEHAVLHGHRALVCAINRRITVRLFPSSDELVRIESALGTYKSRLSQLSEDASFRFVLQAIHQYAGRCSSGFRLEIESEFSADIGFGSSAAVTVATHAAILRWLQGESADKTTLFNAALETVHAVQGRGSGADLAASVFGGIVGYTTAPDFVPLAVSLPLTAVFCGYKTPTPEVIRRVEELRAADPLKYEMIYKEMGFRAEEAIECLRKQDLAGFGRILDRNQELMDQMGVNTPELQAIVSGLQAQPDVFGAKISGSGMGDCAVAIGHAELEESGYPVYHLQISPNGCECDE